MSSTQYSWTFIQDRKLKCARSHSSLKVVASPHGFSPLSGKVPQNTKVLCTNTDYPPNYFCLACNYVCQELSVSASPDNNWQQTELDRIRFAFDQGRFFFSTGVKKCWYIRTRKTKRGCFFFFSQLLFFISPGEGVSRFSSKRGCWKL